MALSRRQFILGASGIACCGMAGYPVLRYLIPPRRSAGSGLVVAMAVDELRPLAAVKVPFRNTIAIVLNDGKEIRAFDAACTHLGCIVTWDGAASRFACRCHGGVFAKDGRNISGPPPRPLQSIPIVVRAGKVYLGE